MDNNNYQDNYGQTEVLSHNNAGYSNQPANNYSNFCAFCGSRVDQQTGICYNCGRHEGEIYQQETQPVQPTPPTPQPPIQQVQTPQAQTTQQAYQPTQPSYQPQQAQTFVQPAPIKKKSKPTALNVVLTVLLSILLFVFSTCGLLIFNVRNGISENNAEKLLDNISAEALLDFSDESVSKYSTKFYTYLSDSFGIKIDDDDIVDFLEESTIKSVVAEKLVDFSEDFLTGEKPTMSITEDEVSDFLKDNISLMEDEFSVDLSLDDVEEIAHWMVEGRTIKIFDSEILADDYPVLYYTLTFGLSYFAIILFALICALLIFLMIKNNVFQGLCGTGIVLTIFGALTTIVGLMSAYITSMWTAICANTLVGTIVGNLFAVNILINGIVLALGVVLLITRKLILVIRNKKTNK